MLTIEIGHRMHARCHALVQARAADLSDIVGVALVLDGRRLRGARRQLRPAAAKPGGLDSNAHR